MRSTISYQAPSEKCASRSGASDFFPLLWPPLTLENRPMAIPATPSPVPAQAAASWSGRTAGYNLRRKAHTAQRGGRSTAPQGFGVLEGQRVPSAQAHVALLCHLWLPAGNEYTVESTRTRRAARRGPASNRLAPPVPAAGGVEGRAAVQPTPGNSALFARWRRAKPPFQIA